jgi:hypothetical protein
MNKLILSVILATTLVAFYGVYKIQQESILPSYELPYVLLE